jgi:hypothetical protein
VDTPLEQPEEIKELSGSSEQINTFVGFREVGIGQGA